MVELLTCAPPPPCGSLAAPQVICHCIHNWFENPLCRLPGEPHTKFPMICPADYVFIMDKLHALQVGAPAPCATSLLQPGHACTWKHGALHMHACMRMRPRHAIHVPMPRGPAV